MSSMDISARGGAISTAAVWRQVLCLNVAWIAVLVSLIALPQFLPFTAVAFGGLLVSLGIAWSRQGREAAAANATPALVARPRPRAR